MISSALLEKVKTLSKKYYDLMVEIRHQIHMHPELGWEEVETSKLIQRELNKLKIPFQLIKKIGIIATIKGQKPGKGKCLLLRADMDALPLTEETDVPYKSKIPGKMHACGHDCHTANLLGVAAILNELKDQFSGIIKFMFQPSEECGIGGALPMIKAGILKNPNVDAAIGLHVSNNPINTINYRREISSGCPDDFNVEIHGPGGDAGVPDQTVDVISLGAQFIAAAQTIIARQITTTRPALITFGTFQSSSTDINTIPKVVKLSGTLRCIDEDIRKSMYNKFKNLLASICKTNGATFKFDYLWSYPPVYNDPLMCDLLLDTLSPLIGKANLIEEEHAGLGGEDFAYISQAVPSVFYYVGAKEPNRECFSAHHPKFYVNDQTFFPLASLSLTVMALNYLLNN